MPISIQQTDSYAKSWAPEITASPTGISLAALPVRFGADEYTVPAVTVPCVYDGEPTTYRLALCKHAAGPALVLVEDDTVPSGYEQIVYLARWRLASASDTCATVTIEVPHRTLVQRPPTITDVPIMGLVPKPVLDADGNPVLDENGEPVVQMVERQIGTEQVTTPAPSLPPPTVHAVSTTVVVPAQTAERTRDRKVRKRVRELRQSARDMKQAGTTYAAMTAAQRQIIGELVALDPTGEVPMEIP